MPRLSLDIRNQALGMIRAGMTVRGVAAQLNVDKNTERVRRLILSMRRRCMALMGARGGHTKY